MSHLNLAPIGNCAVAGLIDARACHVWFCFQRLDADPVFNALASGQPHITLRMRPTFGNGSAAPQVSIGSNHARFIGSENVLGVTTDTAVSERSHYLHPLYPIVSRTERKEYEAPDLAVFCGMCSWEHGLWHAS
ncbi:MAG TPA: hypothetical protein VGC27_13945 [Rhizomicrobium sp.]